MLADDDAVLAFYRDAYKKFGDTPEGMAWTNKDDHYRRLGKLKQLLEVLDPDWSLPKVVDVGEDWVDKQTRILDVGCGIGLLPWLWDIRNRSFMEYHGVDLVPEYIEIARHSFTGQSHINFTLENFLQHGAIDPYDVTVAVGVIAWQPETTALLILQHMWENTKPGGSMMFTYLPGRPLADAVVRMTAQSFDVAGVIAYSGYVKTGEVMVGWSKKWEKEGADGTRDTDV